MGQDTGKSLGSRIAAILFDSIKLDFSKRPEIWFQATGLWRLPKPINRKGRALVWTTYSIWAVLALFVLGIVSPPNWVAISVFALFCGCVLLTFIHSEWSNSA